MSQEGPLKKQKLLKIANEESTKEMEESEERDYNSSPDMFADSSTPERPEENDQSNDVVIQIENDMEIDEEAIDSAISNAGTITWKGISLEEIMEGCDNPQLPPIKPSEFHRVLFRVPVTPGEVPEAYPRVTDNGVEDLWDSYHVRMPHSPQSQYVVQDANGVNKIESRWTIIKDAFSRTITSSHELAEAILSYNSKYVQRWDFQALHYFFNNELPAEESENFFSHIVPSIVDLALLLPDLVTAPIPLLRRHRTRSLSLGQLQIASLLANAFLCTFPRRNAAHKKSEYASFPDINFNRLFCSTGAGKPLGRNVEKLTCIFNYFRRVADSYPEGVVTFTRRYVERDRLPRWDRLEATLPALHVASVGTIEDDGAGMLQVDFANSFVGGGVLGSGCVQEEIRFVICPELIVTRLFTEELDVTEALLITGCERYSDYSGYADSFKWTANFVDATPVDGCGRRRCSVVAIDALYLRNPDAQFAPKCMLREVNKAFVGFANPELPAGHSDSPVATGNWGCGAFRGDAALKALLQLMAAAAARRNVAYFTFGDAALRDSIHAVHAFLVEQRVSVARLWSLLAAYHRSFRNGKPAFELYAFLFEAVINNTQFPDVRDKSKPSKLSRNSTYKVSYSSKTSRKSRLPEEDQSSSRIDSDDLERALEESLREEEAYRRERIPEMDDAMREARLLFIENSGVKNPVPQVAVADPERKASSRLPNGAERRSRESTDADCCEHPQDFVPSQSEGSVQDRGVSTLDAGTSKGSGPVSSGAGEDVVPERNPESAPALDSSLADRGTKAEVKSSGALNSSASLPKNKITDYFSNSPRYK